jgi:peptidoglycan/LPS O-acetylase OafA/YrhL
MGSVPGEPEVVADGTAEGTAKGSTDGTAEGSVAVARYRPGLDGLRGLAVAVVVAYHVGYLRGGFLGVDVFFVLSGYLITGLVLAELEGTGRLSLRRFWARRARRLVPALMVVVALVLAACIALDWPRNRFGALRLDATSSLTWWANWRQAGGTSYWTGVTNPFRHAWSLSIEEQFYVAWPLVVGGAAWVARRLGRSVRVAVGSVAVLGAAASGTWQVVLARCLAPDELSRVYVGTDTRVVAPLVGCTLATVPWHRVVGPAHVRWRRLALDAAGLLGAGVLAVAVAQVEVDRAGWYRSGGFVAVALASAALVRAAAAVERGDRDPVALATANPVSRWLGTRSYAIYLWSWPIQVLVRSRRPDWSDARLAVVAVAASLAAAEASFRVVEHPIRHRAGWARSPRRRRPAWAAAVATPLVLLAVVAGEAVPPPVHEQVDTAEAAADALHRPPPTTVPGDRDLRVMVEGDSVAWTVAYYAPLPGSLPEGIASVDSRGLIGCGLLAAEGWKYQSRAAGGAFTEPAGGACAQQPEIERIGLAAHPDVVLLFPGAWEYIAARDPSGHEVAARSDEMADLLVDRLRRRIRAADAVGARFVLVQWSCPGRLVTDPRGDPDYIAWIDGLLDRAAAEARAADGARVDVLRPTDAVCVGADPTGDPTPAKAEATGDEVHITSHAGGRWVWDRWLGPALVAMR